MASCVRNFAAALLSSAGLAVGSASRPYQFFQLGKGRDAWPHASEIFAAAFLRNGAFSGRLSEPTLPVFPLGKGRDTWVDVSAPGTSAGIHL